MGKKDPNWIIIIGLEEKLEPSIELTIIGYNSACKILLHRERMVLALFSTVIAILRAS